MNRRTGVRRRWWAALIAGTAALVAAATARRSQAPATADVATEIQRLTAARDALGGYDDAALRRAEARTVDSSTPRLPAIEAIRGRAAACWAWTRGATGPAGESWVVTHATGNLQAWHDAMSLVTLVEGVRNACVESLEIEAGGARGDHAFRRIKIVVRIGGSDSNRVR